MESVACFGEIMLRLKAPGCERLLQSGALEACFGGCEANVAVSLARFGARAEFVSALPDNPLGDAALSALRAQGVGTAGVARGEGRMGLYFLEAGASQRPSRVLYDREGSAFARRPAAAWDWPALLAGSAWLHVSGISPALGQAGADATLAAVRAARRAGARVSLDLNYRHKLWNWGRAATELMPELCAGADLLFANEEDIQRCLGLELPAGEDAHRRLLEATLERFPNLEAAASTLRVSHSADRNGWSALLVDRRACHRSREYDLTGIVDRLGAGDAFAAGLIWGRLRGWEPADALEFACAAGCLKHSVHGDWNLVGADEVAALARGSGSGRIVR